MSTDPEVSVLTLSDSCWESVNHFSCLCLFLWATHTLHTHNTSHLYNTSHTHTHFYPEATLIGLWLRAMLKTLLPKAFALETVSIQWSMSLLWKPQGVFCNWQCLTTNGTILHSLFILSFWCDRRVDGRMAAYDAALVTMESVLHIRYMLKVSE